MIYTRTLRATGFVAMLTLLVACGGTSGEASEREEPQTVTVPVASGQASADGTTGDDDISQDGSLVGGQAGAEYWLTDEVGLLGTVGVEYLSFSAADGLPERSGWSLRPQVGLKLRY